MRNLRTALLSVLVLSGAGFVVGSTTRLAEDDAEAVGKTAAQFFTALNAMFTEDLGPMKAVWSHADDVTYMGPGGGFQVGWDGVLANWEKQAAMKLGGEERPGKMRITVGRGIAVVHNYERGQNTADGKSVMVSIRATNLFRKDNGRWKMIGHHTDLLPFMQDERANRGR